MPRCARNRPEGYPATLMTCSYSSYIAWRRLTHNGQRDRQQMSPGDQQEWDALGIREGKLLDADPEEARRSYLAVARP
jgi:hypothetical protein